jgi:hypothetical protein
MKITLNTILRNPLLKAKMAARWLFPGRGLMRVAAEPGRMRRQAELLNFRIVAARLLPGRHGSAARFFGANCQSCGNGSLKKTATTLPPRAMIKRCRSR